MNEFQIIKKYFCDWRGTGVEPLLGIGDDGALVEVDPASDLVVAADTLVAGRHFPLGADPALVASRALRVNLSDMAAMGAKPLHYTLCLSLAEADQGWLESFAKSLRKESTEFACSLIGGDTTRGELSISLQFLGLSEKHTALKRSAARSGDSIWVTGNLGDAAGYLHSEFREETLAARFWAPQPRIDFALAAKPFIHACLDISDGLLADLGHICTASDLGAELQLEAIPLSEQLLAFAGSSAIELALSGGDDYELCFTAPADSGEHLKSIAAQQNLRLTEVGRMVVGSGVECLDARGVKQVIQQRGYSHF